MSAFLPQSVADLQFGLPNDNEHKEEKQSARQDGGARAFKFLDNTAYNMVNPLVLAICISAYDSDKLENLKGAKKDMDTLKKLWKDTFGFEMITNKINKKTSEYHLTKAQFETKLDVARVKLKTRNDEKDNSDSEQNSININKKDGYDGLIFVFAGHGYTDGIFTSDGQRIPLKTIKKHFSSKNVPSLKDSPKIFIIDACRFSGQLLPFEDNTLYKDPHFNEKRGNKQLPKFKFYHPYVNMLEVYGNTRGYSVAGNDKKGGSLITVLSEYLSHAYNSDMTFQQILNGMKRELHKNTGGNQTIEIHDTLLYDVKFNKGHDQVSHAADIAPNSNGTYVNQFFHCLNFVFELYYLPRRHSV